jgi:hypothetical protein
MKQVDGQRVQVDIAGRKKAVGSSIVEEGPVPGGSNVEYVGVRGAVLAGPPKLFEMHVRIRAELADEKVSVRIVSDYAQSVDIEAAVEFGEIEGDIERASTPTHRFGTDVGDGVLGRVLVDNLDEIENPVSGAGNTFP